MLLACPVLYMLHCFFLFSLFFNFFSALLNYCWKYGNTLNIGMLSKCVTRTSINYVLDISSL